MTPLEGAVLVLILALPPHWLVARHFRQLADPAYLRRHGIVIERESALEARSAPIGRYQGIPIPGSVVFRGMWYRFDRVIDRCSREFIGPGQLFLEPGLLYVAV